MKTELQCIREELGLNRPQFSRLCIKRSLAMLVLYETNKNKIPLEVIKMAREWLEFKEKFNKKWGKI